LESYTENTIPKKQNVTYSSSFIWIIFLHTWPEIQETSTTKINERETMHMTTARVIPH